MIRVAMTSELSQQGNDAITSFTSAMILGIGNLTKSFTGAFFSNTVASRGGALGYFLGGYVPPGTPNWYPVLEKISPKIDTPS